MPEEHQLGKLSHLSRDNFHALLIGINEYMYFHHLRGASRDMNGMKAFLINSFDVSVESQLDIRTMTETSSPPAKKDDIIRAIQDLCHDPKIKWNDSILIYFAGHGATLPPPEGWPGWTPEPPASGFYPKNTEIQCIVALDAEIYEASSFSHRVRGVIPDRTMNILLRQLAEEKGNNITVILDCCHSGSGTRIYGTNGELFRGVLMTEPGDASRRVTIPGDYDEDIWRGYFDPNRGGVLSSKYRHAGLGSHVLLAACAHDQTAADEFSFTMSLIEALAKYDLRTLSYADLIKRLTGLSDRQNPLCEGNSVASTLFDLKDIQLGRLTFDVILDGGIPVLGAGQLLGIVDNTEFDIFTSQAARLYDISTSKLKSAVNNVKPTTSSFRSLGLVARRLQVDLSTAVASPSFPSADVFAVYIPSAALRAAVKLAVEQENPEDRFGRPRIDVDGTATGGKLIITEEDGHVHFHHQTSSKAIPNLFGLQKLAFHIYPEPASIRRVLRAAAHFFKFLLHAPMMDGFRLRDFVEVKVHELWEGKATLVDGQLVSPLEVGKTLSPNLGNGAYEVMAAPDEASPDMAPAYGIELTNKLPCDELFAWLFLFDCSSLQITSYYEPRVSKGTASASATLPRAGENCKGIPIPLNFKSGPGKVLQLQLYPGQDLDVSYLRIFLATKYRGGSLVSICQAAPLKLDDRGRWRGEHRTGLAERRMWDGLGADHTPGGVRPDIWDVVDIPLIQTLA